MSNQFTWLLTIEFVRVSWDYVWKCASIMNPSDVLALFFLFLSYSLVIYFHLYLAFWLLLIEVWLRVIFLYEGSPSWGYNVGVKTVLNCTTLLTHDFFDYCFLDLWFLSSQHLDLGSSNYGCFTFALNNELYNSSGTSVLFFSHDNVFSLLSICCISH